MCVRVSCIEGDSRLQKRHSTKLKDDSLLDESGLSDAKSSGASDSSSLDLRTWLCALVCSPHLSSSLPDSEASTCVSNTFKEIGGSAAILRFRL
jgi:hypothetical protein